jgi:hypothetical protein
MLVHIRRCFTCVTFLICRTPIFILYFVSWNFEHFCHWPTELTHATSVTYSSFLTTRFSLQVSKIHLNVVLLSHGICLRLSYLSVSSFLCLFPMQVAQVLLLLTCILGVSNLISVQTAAIPAECFLWITQFVQADSDLVPLSAHEWLIPSKSYTIHNSPFIP